MREALEGTSHIPWHGKIDGAVVIVPVEGEATIRGARPVFGVFIFLPDDTHEMLSVFASHVLNTEVIDDEAKHDGAGFMAEESRSVLALMISIGG